MGLNFVSIICIFMVNSILNKFCNYNLNKPFAIFFILYLSLQVDFPLLLFRIVIIVMPQKFNIS